MAQENNSANLLQRVEIEGVLYELKGKVDFSQLTITKVGTTVPPTEPPTEPPVEPGEVDPTTGTIKEGSKWSKNPGDAGTWQVVEMGDSDKQGLWKIIAADKLNVIADLPSKEIGLQLIEYFKTHKFPPEEGTTTQPPIEPGTEPPVVTPGGKGVTKDGVQLLFADGSTVKEGYNENFRDDGKRYDNNVGDWKASEATGYFRFTKDPVDDEVSIKWSEKSHSGNNEVQCYDTGVGIKDGKVRMRFENPHPDYSGNIGSGQGSPLGTKWVGYKGVKIPQQDGSVLIELYQDTGDNEGTKPANQWKKIYSHVDTKYKRTGAHPYVTIRVDDPGKNGQKNLEAKWISVAKIA